MCERGRVRCRHRYSKCSHSSTEVAAVNGSYRTALISLAEVFGELILTDQDCFASREGWEALLHLIPDAGIVKELREKWDADPHRSSSDKWADLKSQGRKYKGTPRRVGIFSYVKFTHVDILR